jgi:hypothetical protein
MIFPSCIVTSIRVIVAMAVILGLAFSAQASEYPACGPPRIETSALLGPVRSVRVEESGVGGRRELTGRYVFDRAGRLLEDRRQIMVGDSPSAVHTGFQVFRYIYETQGRNYEIHTFEIDPAQGEKPGERDRHLVKFDSLGRCFQERDIDSAGEFNGENTYEYDSRGDLIREIVHSSDGTISSIEDRIYSPDHKLLSEKAIENRGQGLAYRWSREYKYDARGNQTDMFSYQQGILEAHWVFKYDERNRRVSSETIVADPKKDQQAYGECSDCGLSSGEATYKYDDAGQVTEERMFQPGNRLVSVQTYRYDAHRNRLPSPDSIYSYDSHGNWIKEVPPSRTSARIRYRVIDYY